MGSGSIGIGRGINREQLTQAKPRERQDYHSGKSGFVRLVQWKPRESGRYVVDIEDNGTRATVVKIISRIAT